MSRIAEQAVTGRAGLGPVELLKLPTLSVEELATVTGVGLHTAYGMVREGRVKTLRAGRRYRVLTSSVREMLDGLL